MTEQTPLDRAHAAMQTGGDASRLRFYERLADTDLFVLLEKEPTGDKVSPETFDIEEGHFVLAFDLQERLAEFKSQVAPYAAMSGRVLIRMLGGQGIGLGLNLEVAGSAVLIPADAIDWLNRTLARVPDQVTARITAYTPPTGLPGGLLDALEDKLANTAGLANLACLVGVIYENGKSGYLLGFVGAEPRAQSALAKAAGEVLTFADPDDAPQKGDWAGVMDVGFFAVNDPVVAKLTSVGYCLDLLQPDTTEIKSRPAPGSDPKRPPILR